MNRFASMILLGAGFLGIHAPADAQGRTYPQGSYSPYQDRYGNDRYDGRYNDRYRGNQESLVSRVLGDLDRAVSNARLDGHERKHFDEAAGKLQEFDNRWAQGKFDTGKLDKAIDNLAHLADADRLRPRDRDMLARDVDELRRFRADRGRYSNNRPGDYRDDPYDRNQRYDRNSR